MLTLRMIGANDYNVPEDGQPIGRIRYASERTPGIFDKDRAQHASITLRRMAAFCLGTSDLYNSRGTCGNFLRPVRPAGLC
jgi:hypothetical protein